MRRKAEKQISKSNSGGPMLQKSFSLKAEKGIHTDVFHDISACAYGWCVQYFTYIGCSTISLIFNVDMDSTIAQAANKSTQTCTHTATVITFTITFELPPISCGMGKKDPKNPFDISIPFNYSN